MGPFHILYFFLVIPSILSPPYVFGSTCFVHLLSLGRDKLSPRSIKCVFLGFRHQKGYKCYSLSQPRDIIITRAKIYLQFIVVLVTFEDQKERNIKKNTLIKFSLIKNDKIEDSRYLYPAINTKRQSFTNT